MTTQNHKAATAVEKTANSKTGPVSVTMASQGSCPETCAFLKSGCYAESGPQGIHTSRLNKAVATPEEIAKAEAIGTLSGTRPLRLHVVGDAKTDACAAILADAVKAYAPAVWTYTHAWRNVNRASWGSKVSVLASCETPADVRNANAAGYNAALVVEKFSSDKTHSVDGVRVTPCPQQTGKAANCATCKLCFDDSKLRNAGITIAFEVHGSGVKKASAKLTQIGATN